MVLSTMQSSVLAFKQYQLVGTTQFLVTLQPKLWRDVKMITKTNLHLVHDGICAQDVVLLLRISLCVLHSPCGLSTGRKANHHKDLTQVKRNKDLVLDSNTSLLKRLRFFSYGEQLAIIKCHPTSHSDLVAGPLVPRILSSISRLWIYVYPSGGGKYGCDFCPKLNSTAQFFTKTWGNRARPASASLVVRKATPNDTPFFEKLISTSSPLSKSWNDGDQAGMSFWVSLWQQHWQHSQKILILPFIKASTTYNVTADDIIFPKLLTKVAELAVFGLLPCSSISKGEGLLA